MLEGWCTNLHAAYPRFSWRTAAVGAAPNVNDQAKGDCALMEVKRIATDLGFVPRFGAEEAFKESLEWIRTHEAFVRSGE